MRRRGRSLLLHYTFQNRPVDLLVLLTIADSLFLLLSVHLSVNSGKQLKLIRVWLLITADFMSSPLVMGNSISFSNGGDTETRFTSGCCMTTVPSCGGLSQDKEDKRIRKYRTKPDSRGGVCCRNSANSSDALIM